MCSIPFVDTGPAKRLAGFLFDGDQGDKRFFQTEAIWNLDDNPGAGGRVKVSFPMLDCFGEMAYAAQRDGSKVYCCLPTPDGRTVTFHGMVTAMRMDAEICGEERMTLDLVTTGGIKYNQTDFNDVSDWSDAAPPGGSGDTVILPAPPAPPPNESIFRGDPDLDEEWRQKHGDGGEKAKKKRRGKWLSVRAFCGLFKLEI